MSHLLIDLKGKAFGFWTVIERGENDRRGQTRWWCQCHCGRCDDVTRQVRGTNLRSGTTRSCGGKRGYTRHGHASRGKWSPTYMSWVSMVQRGTNTNATGWANYGGRGITVCTRWRDSFENFLVDMGPRPADRTLDRIDNNKLTDGYSPENCRWASAKTQRANQRNNTTRSECVTYHQEALPC